MIIRKEYVMQFKQRKIFWLLMGVSILLTGCKGQQMTENTQVAENTQMQTQQTQTESPLYSEEVNLCHTGEKWNIKTYMQKQTLDTPEFYQVKVYDENNREIWKSDKIAPQDEMSYYLVHKKDGEYLLSYQPLTDSGGTCNFSYRVFYVDPEGTEITAAQDQVEFDTILWSGKEPLFPEEKMIEFANGLNKYLDDAIILVNTTHEGLSRSTQEHQATFHEDYRDVLDQNGTDDLEENVSRLHEKLYQY